MGRGEAEGRGRDQSTQGLVGHHEVFRLYCNCSENLRRCYSKKRTWLYLDFRKSLQCVQWVEGGSSDQFGGGGGGTFMYEIMVA